MSKLILKLATVVLPLTIIFGFMSPWAMAAHPSSCREVFTSKAFEVASFDATSALRKITDELAEDMHPLDKAEALAKALDTTGKFSSEAQIFQLWSAVIEAAVQTRLRDDHIGELQMKLAQNLEFLPVKKRMSGAMMLLRDWQPKAGGKSKKPVLTEDMINARIAAVNVLAQMDANASKTFFENAILRDPKNTNETLLYGVEGMVQAIYKFWPRQSPRYFRNDIQILANEVHSLSMAALRGGDLMSYLEVRNRLEEIRERQAD